MRLILSVFLALLSAPAFAVPVYDCTLSAKEKDSNQNTPWVKKEILSPAFTNEVDFNANQTKLLLDVNAHDNTIYGFVNDQWNFLLSGTVANGSFESAYHTGNIQCGALQELPFVLKFIPWNQYFTDDAKFNSATKAELGAIQSAYLCFLGDATAAAAAISADVGVQGKVLSPTEISFTWTAKECVDGAGQWDNFQCTSWADITHTQSVQDCSGDQWSRP